MSVCPPIPANITQLNCSNNRLTELQGLPAGLQFLWCDNNQLTSLPDLPAGLISLHCHNNQLIKLPQLPDRLIHLLCQHNRLTSLPNLPATLQSINVLHNPFPARLQTIVDKYMHEYDMGYIYVENIPKLIRAVNQYNVEEALRQAGHNIIGLHSLRTRLPLQRYNMPPPPNIPNWLSEKVMHTLTGIQTKRVARPNATGKLRPPGNLRQTLKNLKRTYNELPGRRNRRKKQTRKQRR